MRRAILLSSSAVPGGAERALTALARRLPAEGWNPVGALLQHGPVEAWFEEVDCPVELLLAGRVRHLHRTVATILRLAALVRRSGAQAIISNQTKSHVYGGLAGRLAGVPTFFWQQGIPAGSWIDRVGALVPASAIVASCREAVAAQRAISPRSRVELIHLGVGVTGIARRAGSGEAIRRQLGLSTRQVAVGIVGRLQPWKGQRVFLEAARRVARTRPEAVFLVVGGAILGWEGDYPAELERFVAECPELNDRVRFVGHQEDVLPWFDALDVVVHASRGEPFGLVVLEAMALGRPVVAAAEGGPAEIVEDGVSGLLVRPDQPGQLAEAILRILGDQDLATHLSEGARRRAEVFSDVEMARRWADLLNENSGPIRRGTRGGGSNRP